MSGWASLAIARALAAVSIVTVQIAGAQSSRPTGTPSALAITHVTVVDVEHLAERADQTVVVAGGRITAVGPSASTSIPRDAHRVDGRGNYVIPGLWDMGAWVIDARRCYPGEMQLFVAVGVLGVRDFGSSVPLAQSRALKDSILTGLMVGPRLLLPGPALGEMRPERGFRVNSDAHARRVVDSLAAAGADYIKLMMFIRGELLPVIIDAARAHHLMVSAEVASGYKEAMDAGLRIIDHPQEMMRTVSKDRAAYARVFRDAESLADLDSAITVEYARAYGSQALDTAAGRKRAYTWFASLTSDIDSAYYKETVETLRRTGTFMVDNSTVEVTKLLRFEVFDPMRLRFRTADGNRELFKLISTDTRFVEFLTQYDRFIRGTRGPQHFLAGLRQQGIRLIPGTQLGCGQGGTPGLSLHDELLLFTEAGYTPLEALRGATLDAASMMHAADTLGSIAAGKRADLVLLDHDPAVDIRNTLRIRAVVANGRYFDRSALDSLLAGAERAAAIPPR